MDDKCSGTTEKQSRFGALNDTLQNISGDLKQITRTIAGHLDRLVGEVTEEAETEPPQPSEAGLVGVLEGRVGMLQRRVTELHEQLNRVDGKF